MSKSTGVIKPTLCFCFDWNPKCRHTQAVSINNAQATAEQFATDTKSDLGDIRSAQQGQFSIEDRDSNTPYIKKIRVVNTMTYSLK